MGKAKEPQSPVQQSVHVDCPIEEAFRLFTERFAEWWPLSRCSVTGEDAETCAIEPWEGGRVFERTRSGEESEWGSVTLWDPPNRVEFTWHPGEHAYALQTVAVEFQREAEGTRVTLTHAGWQEAGVAVSMAGAAQFAKFVSQQMLVAA